jgi:DNA-binding XRE family transcriptional regulator
MQFCHVTQFKLMSPQRLPNYIRTHRKNANLTQRDVAFLLGYNTSAHVCRHERRKQVPNLQTLLAYEILFHTPIRSIYAGVHQDVEQKLLRRVRLLIHKLTTSAYCHINARKIKILNTYLNEQSFPTTFVPTAGNIHPRAKY